MGAPDFPYIASMQDQTREYYSRRIIAAIPEMVDNLELQFGNVYELYIRKVNEGLIPDAALKNEISVFTAESLGIKGDTTSEAAKINSAIDKVPAGSVIWFDPNKTYVLGGSIANAAKSVHLQSRGCTFIANTHAAQLNLNGTWGSSYPVSSVTTGTVTTNAEVRYVLNIAVTGTLPYARGDIIKLYADDVIPGGRPGDGTLESRVGQWAVVYSVADGNIAVLAKELIDPMTTNIRISKLNKIYVSADGIDFDTTSTLMNDGLKSNCIVFSDLVSPKITNCKIKNSTAQAIQVNYCYSYRVTDVEINNSNDITANSQYGYGVLDNSSAFGIIDGLLVNFVRHGYSDDTPRIAANSGPSAYGRTYGNIINNSICYGSSNSAWDTHACSQNITFSNIQALGSGGPAVGLRGRFHTVKNLRVGVGRDWGVYAFSESDVDTYSYGHTVDGVVIEGTAQPVTFACNKLSNTRETRPSRVTNVTVNSPEGRTIWVVNATVNIGQVFIDEIQNSVASSNTVDVSNSLVTVQNIYTRYKAGIANNSPVGIKLTGASDLYIAKAVANFNGTTNGTRFNPYISSDATSIYRIDDLTFFSNPTSVSNFSTDHTDSYVRYKAPLGNALGISSAYIKWTDADTTAPKHALKRSGSDHVLYEAAIANPVTLTSMLAGRHLGQQMTVYNSGTATLTMNNVTTIVTKTGAAITIAAKASERFYWNGTGWVQV